MGHTFHGVIAFAFMVSMILLGTALRAKFRFLQASLVPASLLGGLIGFALISLDVVPGYSSDDFVAFAFHFFTLSFMSLVLTGRESGGAGAEGLENAESSARSIQPGGLWMAVGWTMSLTMQALVGLAVIVAYNTVTGGEISNYLGLLVTHGFTQGPGQAMAMGSIWQSEFQVNDAVSFGLIYASMGFIVSFLIGVPAARFAIQRGLNTNTSARLTDEFLKGVHDQESRPEGSRQVTHSANVDSLAFHISILGFAYVLTHAYLLFLQGLFADAVVGGLPVGVLLSHNLFFIHGLIVCLILRAIMNRLGFGHYIDNETQKRITGTSVDFMMVATVMSIKFTLLAAYIVPIVAVCMAAALSTALMCFVFGRLLNTLPAERAITLFGCCTGSTGSGLLLLRILDPDLSTPVARELAYFNVAILVVSLHILMLMAPILPTFSLTTICLVYGGTFAVGAVLLRFLSPRT